LAAIVLVVDDEPAVLDVARDILETSGYQVLSAASGEEALALAREQQGPIHVLLTDLAMPGMNGRQLADRLSRLRPETRVMFMSALSREMIVDYGVPEGSPFVIKPFTIARLTEKVAQVLAQPARVAWPRTGPSAGRDAPKSPGSH